MSLIDNEDDSVTMTMVKQEMLPNSELDKKDLSTAEDKND